LVIPFDVEQQDTGSAVLNRILARLRTTLGSLTQAVTNDRLVDVTFAAVDTDVQVFHGLGFPPVSWEVIDRDAAVTVWRSTTVNPRPRDTIILRASAAPLTVRIRFNGQQGPRPFPPSDIPFTGGPSGTPSALARYWLSIADASLPNAVDLGALGDGILYQTVAAGISTPAIVAIGGGLSFTGGTLSVPSVAARFWVSEASADLANEVNLGALGNGTLQQTVAAGVSTPTAFAGTTGSIPFYAASSQLAQDNTNLFWNDTTNALTLGGDVLMPRLGNQSIDKSGSGALFIGTSSATSLSLYTNGTVRLDIDNAGKLVFGSTSTMFFDEATSVLSIGNAAPSSFIGVQYNRSTNGGVVFGFSNPNTGGVAYTSFSLGNDAGFTVGFSTALFSTGSAYGSPYGPGIVCLEKFGNSSNMHFWIDQNVGDFVWFTKAIFPNAPERMRITTGGVVSINDLGAAGTGRLVQAAVTTGILSIASASDVAGAIAWPPAATVLVSTGTSTAPTGVAAFSYDTGAQHLILGEDVQQSWHNLGEIGDTTYERVRALWSSNTWVLVSESSGGTVRDIAIEADTATLTLNGATARLTSAAATVGVFVSSLAVAVAAPVIRASAAGATLNAISVSGSTVSITGSTNITTAAGFNYVNVAAPTYSGTGGAKTITNAVTVAIVGPPVAAGDVTITTAITFWVQAGRTRLDGHATVAGSGSDLGFFGFNGAPMATVTGSRGGNAALASLLTALAGYNLLTDSSTA